MRFEAKSDAELADAALLADNDYDFEVVSAEETTSKSGNDMIAMVLKVFDGEGGSRPVRDWLVSTEGGLRKISGFAKSVGMTTEYKSGELSAYAIEKAAGRCRIKRDPNIGYEPKNTVAYYIDPDRAAFGGGLAGAVSRPVQQAVRQSVPTDLDDEIPF